MKKEILGSVKLIEKLNLDVNKESVALVSAIKRIGCEIKQPMKITVEPLSNGGKLIKVNDINMVYLRGGLCKTLHDVLKDLSMMVTGESDYIGKPLREFEDSFLSKIIDFPEEYENNIRELFIEYYKEYLVDNLDEILLNADNESFINYNINFRKKDWYICSIEAMTALLLDEIVCKKFYKSSRILRINVINNYNGTRTFIMYYNNKFKREYLVKG